MVVCTSNICMYHFVYYKIFVCTGFSCYLFIIFPIQRLTFLSISIKLDFCNHTKCYAVNKGIIAIIVPPAGLKPLFICDLAVVVDRNTEKKLKPPKHTT